MRRTSQIRVVAVANEPAQHAWLSALLANIAGITPIGSVCNLAEAPAFIAQAGPDVVLLHLNAPGHELNLLESLMHPQPRPIVVHAAPTKAGAEAVIRALELGVVECMITTPHATGRATKTCQTELAAKIRLAAKAPLVSRGTPPASPLSFHPARAERDIIALGAATGGVAALHDILVRMPHNAPPMIVAQHLPKGLIASLIARLDGLCVPHVKEAEHHEKLLAGTVYFVPDGKWVTVSRIGNHYASRVATASKTRASADTLFASLAQAAGPAAVGVILTGAGTDGAAGMPLLRNAGAATMGQTRESCPAYGMPKAAKRAGGTEAEWPLPEIAARMLKACYNRTLVEQRA